MKKLELYPSKENILKTLKDDLGGRNENIVGLLNLIDSIEDNTTIALDGKWGSGKTFFIKQFIEVLKYFNENMETDKEISDFIKGNDLFKEIKNEEITNIAPIYYNAWENDSDEDPLLSILLHLVNNEGMKNGNKLSANTQDKVLSISKSIASIIGAALPILSGIKGSIDSIEDTIAEFVGKSLTEPVDKNRIIRDKIKELLENILENRGDKMLIVIDELDRCSPIFAFDLLEKVKNLMNDDRFIFLFVTNKKELSHTISRFYGNNFSSYEYLDKFFDFSLELKPISVGEYVEHISGINRTNYFDNVAYYIINNYHFSLRECNRYLQLLDIIKNSMHIGESTLQLDEENQAYHFMMTFLVPILIGFKIKDINKYYSFIEGREKDFFCKLILKDQDFHNQFKKQCLRNIETVDPIEEIISKIYDTIFKNTLCSSRKEVKKYDNGIVHFDHYSKNDLLRILSMLSSESNYKY